jgi:uncharacterized protein
VTTIDEDLVQEMAQVIVREVAPQQIIVFGSWAKGTAGPDSDVDLMVIEAAPFGPGRDRRREMVRIWRALARFAVPKDILVYSRHEVEQWRGALNHVIAKALREGKVLYDESQ